MRQVSSPKTMFELRNRATLRCPKGPSRACDPRLPPDGPGDICLFDVRADPCETNNLTPQFPNVARFIFQELVNVRKTLVPQLNVPQEVDLADPAFFNGTWSPWYDLSGNPLTSINAIPDANTLFSPNIFK